MLQRPRVHDIHFPIIIILIIKHLQSIIIAPITTQHSTRATIRNVIEPTTIAPFQHLQHFYPQHQKNYQHPTYQTTRLTTKYFLLLLVMVNCVHQFGYDRSLI